MKAVLTLSAACILWAVLAGVGLNPLQPLADAQMDRARQQTLQAQERTNQVRIAEQERTERAFIRSQERLERAAMRQETLLVVIVIVAMVGVTSGVMAVAAVILYTDSKRRADRTVLLPAPVLHLPEGFQPVHVEDRELIDVRYPVQQGGGR